MREKIKSFLKDKNPASLQVWKYIGPGFLVTIGFIDPGNWSVNIAAGSYYGYDLLWVITLSTIILIYFQHNAAHLGIVSGLCLSEAATKYLKPYISRTILFSAVLASVSTAFAEIFGGAVALKMIFGIPLKISAILVSAFSLWMLFNHSYNKIEKWIIGFVSLIGLSFIFEIFFVDTNWRQTAISCILPDIPLNSMVIIMSVLGAVVMPHNIFLHSEIIQSRQINLKDESVKIKMLKYEFYDTIFSMIIGFAINSAIIIVAAAVFFNKGIKVTELEQAQNLLSPLLGKFAAIIFALALLFAGIASSITAGMAGGSIFAGIMGEPYDIKDKHTKTGIILTITLALIFIFLIENSLNALIYSQMVLSIQLPFTIITLIYLTSSKQIMGKYHNTVLNKLFLWSLGLVIILLNIKLLLTMFV
ncbi:MAG: Nramp family divalent metal transporter [Bacteroidota bacterium]|nr:Nramp family divalent metal transporter [Bacteroidota bacterium]